MKIVNIPFQETLRGWRTVSFQNSPVIQNFSGDRAVTGPMLYSESETLKDWKERIRLNKDATTPRVCTRQSLAVSPAVVSVRNGVKSPLAYDTDYIVTGLLNPDLTHFISSGSTDTDVVPLALQRFWSKVYNVQDKFEGASAALEARELLGGFKDLWHEIHELIVDRRKNPFGDWRFVSARVKRDLLIARNGKGGAALRKQLETAKSFKVIASSVGRLRVVAALWLQTQFNLRPLVSDVSAICEKLYFNAVFKGLKVRLKAGASEPQIFPAVFGSSTGATDPGLSFTGDAEWRYAQQVKRMKFSAVRGAVLATPISSIQRFGFDPGSWILGGWEVVPASFLVDYVLPIGQWIESLLGRKLAIQYGCVTTVMRKETRITVTARLSSLGISKGSVLTYNRPLKAVMKQNKLKRVQVTGATGLNLPQFFIAPSFTRLFNATALLFLFRTGNTHRSFLTTG